MGFNKLIHFFEQLVGKRVLLGSAPEAYFTAMACISLSKAA
jgi:hypothetical protein